VPTYTCKDRTLEVSGTNAKGEEVRVSFAKGTYTTKKDDEVALLDACATDPTHPIAFDQKEE